MNRKIIVIWMLLLITVSGFAAASKSSKPDPAPMVMIKNVTSEMLGELDRHIGRLKNNNKLVDSLVNRVLVPHFDLMDMGRSVVGRNYWKQSSGVTKQQFIKEFTKYITSTYSSALQSYDGERMKFYPIRGAVGKKVRISSDLLLKNGPSIQLQYGLVYKGSRWLIYDFSVDGVSIVKNYQAQFASVLRRSGLDGLVRQLKKRNVRR